VLRETTSRGLCGRGCPSRTSERGGEGDCVKEGGFSSRMKSKMKGKNYAVFYFIGKRNFFFFYFFHIYDVKIFFLSFVSYL
jgi:hypothetical protein